MNTDGSNLIERAVRRPLLVQVLTQPALVDCWSLNVSSTGMGLLAGAQAAAADLQVDGTMSLEFVLPDSQARVQAVGRVMWRRELAAGPEQGGAVALGLRFEEMTSSHRSALTRFLLSYQFHVGVLHASPAQREVVEAALEQDARVSFLPDEPALSDFVGQQDASALLVFGQDGEEAGSLIDRVAERTVGRLPSALVLREWAPRLVYVGPAHPDVLLRAFNAAKLTACLPASVPAPELRDAVLEACRDFEMQREQRRLAMAQARAAMRSAPVASGPELPAVVAQRLLVESAPMRSVVDMLRTIAPHKVGVLLQGETGTGKEVLAQTLHDLSDRARAPFVVQDCGTLTETLLESELFGHVKGAFTGAVADHPGIFVIADGGTVFLDEIENTTPKLQAKLLRVIETGEVRPVGGRSVRRVDVRVVCASNRELADEVRAGRFRSDLYYRLNAFPIDIPPLRERVDDIVPLARFFLARTDAAAGRRIPSTLAPETEALLRRHPWPGNVRELKNLIERAAVLATPGRPIEPSLLPPGVLRLAREATAPVTATGLSEQVDAFEREVIRKALEEHQGVMRRAAEALGVSRVTLARKARAHGLLKAGADEVLEEESVG